MNNDNKKVVTIIGSGLAGSYFAILLAKRGYTVEIYERFTEKEIMEDYSAARSYNLTFYEYGVNALKTVGVWETIEPFLVMLEGSIAQIAKNPPVRFKRDSLFFTVQRSTLLRTLIQKARTYPNVTFHFGKPLIALNRSKREITVQDITTKKYLQVGYSIIIGADGVHSLVRTAIQQGHTTTHRQEYANWEYKQIHIDENNAKKMQLEKNFLYAWTRKDTFILAHPNLDHSFSALLVMPKDTHTGFASLQSKLEITNFIKNNYSDFVPATAIVIKEILNNPISNFVTIYTKPWYHKDHMAVIGDAAHAFNPFYGQGVSAGFADCLTLAGLIDTYGTDWRTIFAHYQEARKRHTDALATLSKESIVQHLRQKRADYASIYNKLDTILYRIFPHFFYPPPSLYIPTNPLLAGDYLKNHQTQRRRNMFLGIPLIVGLATGIVALHEAFIKKN
jgi:kynurenine 3-monooxygenase